MLLLLRNHPLIRTLGLSTLLVTSITFLTRLASLYRDRLLAYYVGLGPVVDDFFFLLGISYLLTNLFAVSNINYFIPLIKGEQKNATIAQNNWRVLVTWSGVAILTSGILYFFLKVPGLTASLTALAFLMSSLCYLQAAILNKSSLFVFPSLTFVLPTLGTIVPIVTTQTSTNGLLGYFTAGSFVQFFLLSFGSKESRGYWSFKNFPDAFSGYSAYLKAWLPIFFLSFYFPLPEMVVLAMGKTLGTGAISAIGFSMRVPLSIINIMTFSLWTTILPRVKNESNIFQGKRFAFGLLGLAMGFAALSGVLLALNPLVVKLLYGGGSLSDRKLDQIVAIQAFFFLSIPGQIFANIVMRVLHSLREKVFSFLASGVGLVLGPLYFFLLDPTPLGVAKGFFVSGLGASIMLIMSLVIIPRRQLLHSVDR